MKTSISVFALALALTVATATPARAQGGIIGWSAEARTCVRVAGSAANVVVNGGVTFAKTASGDIKLVCPVESIMRVDPSFMNAFGLTFDNTNGLVGGVDQCSARANFEAYSYSNNFILLQGSFSTNGTPYTGRVTVESPLFTSLTFDTNYYDVFIDLHRASGAACNPIAYVTFVEEVIQ